eukprot:XP_001690326.1 predicted protein [Chlamydomonas reinhardtii]
MGQPAPNTSPQRMRASAAFAPQASQQLQGDWSTLGLPQSAAEDPVLSRAWVYLKLQKAYLKERSSILQAARNDWKEDLKAAMSAPNGPISEERLAMLQNVKQGLEDQVHRLNEDSKQLHRMREQLASLSTKAANTAANSPGALAAAAAAGRRSVSPGRNMSPTAASASGANNAELARSLLQQHSAWLKSFAQQLSTV